MRCGGAMKLDFATVDVFTDRQFGGNPLAVVPDARGLTSAQMQAIAAEFNLSETTFVLPPQDAANTAQVRIFTPRAELPFAGHPNIGTAFVLVGAATSAARAITGDTMIFEENAGLVGIELLRDRSAVTGARLAAPQAFSIGENIAREIVASACSIAPADIDTTAHQPCIASCGIPLIFAAVTSRAALAAANRDFRRARADHACDRRPSLCGGCDAGRRYRGAHVRAPLRRHRRSGDRLRQRGADRSVGHASRRVGFAIGAEDFARRRHGTSEPYDGVGRKTRRQNRRRPYRRQLRPDDERRYYARMKGTQNAKFLDDRQNRPILNLCDVA